jgi:hypothetical protein
MTKLAQKIFSTSYNRALGSQSNNTCDAPALCGTQLRDHIFIIISLILAPSLPVSVKNSNFSAIFRRRVTSLKLFGFILVGKNYKL